MRSAIGWWLIGAVILVGFLTLMNGLELLFGDNGPAGFMTLWTIVAVMGLTVALATLFGEAIE